MTNTVYIATSLDGLIAGKDDNLDWLHDIPNPQNDDLGFSAFMDSVDALVMGRNTFEVVLSFGIDWPYSKPVYVLSNSLTSLPAELKGKVFIVNGPLEQVLDDIHQQGHHNLYIDGGNVIQQFLQHDLIDTLIITTIPVLLGAGTPLFGELIQPLKFRHVSAEPLLDYIVKNTYTRQR
ncbi:dihydrofolate reductase [Shewanella sp. Scap07]|uniref:dihydrofolate reductase family protein n=1 Tax=Shewanella sp. Scap07 TaxID=2589987 RepID=UPI0015C076C8|nr:dihydrofolate reductase family protein [Shewanella sp. Scap07]QLE86680.1 dihydrofolate reductase [Shewanella sp. Scap07]